MVVGGKAMLIYLWLLVSRSKPTDVLKKTHVWFYIMVTRGIMKMELVFDLVDYVISNDTHEWD